MQFKASGMSKKVQNMKVSHKIHYEIYGKLEIDVTAGQTQAKVKLKRGIFLGDLLSPLFFKDDATKLYIDKILKRPIFYKIKRKDISLPVFKW